MIHPHIQRIFDKADRGEQITDEEMLYLQRVCSPPTLSEWAWIISGVVALCVLVFYVVW